MSIELESQTAPLTNFLTPFQSLQKADTSALNRQLTSCTMLLGKLLSQYKHLQFKVAELGLSLFDYTPLL